MIDLRLRFGPNKIPVLRNDEIENHVDALIGDYNPDLFEQPKALDVDDFTENYLGLRLHYTYLSHKGFIWGRMVFHNAMVLVYNPDTGKADEEPVEKNTIIVDNTLLSGKRDNAYRSTVMHECAHWIYHSRYYSIDRCQYINQRQPYTSCNMKNIIGRSVPGMLYTDHDWIEHQAKYFSAAILMPRKAVIKIYKEPFVNQYIQENCRGRENDELVRLLSKTFHVSQESARIRLVSLGLSKKTKKQKDSSFNWFGNYEQEPEF